MEKQKGVFVAKRKVVRYITELPLTIKESILVLEVMRIV